jgi:hypothetical protein
LLAAAKPAGGLRPYIRVVLCSFAALLSLFATTASRVHAQGVRPTETQVKAAYLYKFGNFVRWPVSRRNSQSFEICILGKDPFGSVLDATVAGESMNGKKISVKRLSRIQDAASCSILYVSPSEAPRLDGILPAAGRMNLLTVSDLDRFAESGGVIALISEEGKVRFTLNRDAAEQSDLVLSSELLKVAAKVIENKARK